MEVFIINCPNCGETELMLKHVLEDGSGVYLCCNCGKKFVVECSIIED